MPTAVRRAGAVSAVIGAVTAVTGAVFAVIGVVTPSCVAADAAPAVTTVTGRLDRSTAPSARLSSARIVPSIRLRSHTHIGTHLSLALRRVPHVCPYRFVHTAEVPYSRCARLPASFGSLAASPTSVVAPSSSESCRDSDVADPNQNVSRPKEGPTAGQ